MTVPSESFTSQFEVQLDRFKARNTLKRLESAGCEPWFIVMILEMYCRLEAEIESRRAVKRLLKLIKLRRAMKMKKRLPKLRRPKSRARAADITDFVDKKRSLVVQAEKLAKRLADDADEIEQINGEPDIRQELCRYAMPPVHVTDDMREYISRLKSAAESLRKQWGHSFREEPGEVLAFLADHMKSTTGEDHFADLADLLQVAYAALGKNRDRSCEDVRKIVTRGRQRRKQDQDQAVRVNRSSTA